MLKQPVTQVRLTNVAVVRLKRQGKRFEIACYKNKILNWRSGTETDISEVLQTDSIFQNVSKGQLAKSVDLERIFGVSDTLTIAKIILDKGELQVSDKEREASLEATFKDICSLVADRVFSRRTGLPLSISMLESTLIRLGFSVCIDMNAKRQSLKALQLLCEKLPEEIARTQMILRILCQQNQKEQVITYLKDSIYAMIRTEDIMDNNMTQTDILHNYNYSVTFVCNPTRYREMDFFVTKTLSPSGSLTIMSPRENIINPNEPVHIIDTPTDSSLCHITHECLELNDSIKETVRELPLNDISQQTVLEQSIIPDKPTKDFICCQSCSTKFDSASQYRNHCRTEWHQFNIKRKFKGLPGILEEEFIDLSDDITKGFLAVD